MREIKFRVWFEGLSGTPYMTYTHAIDYGFLNKEIVKIAQDNILMQYTGQKDKNGIEIWEGDIVKDGRIQCKVIWDDSLSGFCVVYPKAKSKPLSSFLASWITVIGNIYENLELKVGGL